MKKLLCVALACILMMSAMCFGVSAAPAEVDGVLWFPCASNRQNDMFWEVECIKQDCISQGFLDNETTTGYKNFLDFAYGADGSLTATRNGNDGSDFYWPRFRTLLPQGTPEIDLNTANTLYFDLEALNANWNVMLGFNGMIIKLSKVMADAAGVGGVASSDADAPAGTFKGAINMQNVLNELAAESGTESSIHAQAIKSMAKVPVPQVSVFCIGAVGASVKINKLYLSTADDTTGANCTYADMSLLQDGFYTDTPIVPGNGGNETPEEPNPLSVEDTLGNLVVTMTVDDDTYTASEIITVVMTAENTGNEPVENVRLESVIPEGYEIKSGTVDPEEGATLNPGDVMTLRVELEPTTPNGPTNPTNPTNPTTPTDPSATPTDPTTAPTTAPTTDPTTGANSDPLTTAPTAAPTTPTTGTTKAPDVPKDAPKTGDTSNALLAIVIAAGAAAAMVLAYKTRGGKQMLSIALCLTLGLGMVAAMPAMTNAEDASSVTLQLTVKVGGEDMVLEGVASYGTSEDTTVTTATETTTTTVPTTTTTEAPLVFSVELPEFPVEVQTHNYAGTHTASCTVDSVTYAVGANGALSLYFNVTKTFDSKGDTRLGSCNINYEIYDSQNNLVASGKQATEALKVGDSCLGGDGCTAHQAITELVPVHGEAYRVVLLDA